MDAESRTDAILEWAKGEIAGAAGVMLEEPKRLLVAHLRRNMRKESIRQMRGCGELSLGDGTGVAGRVGRELKG